MKVGEQDLLRVLWLQVPALMEAKLPSGARGRRTAVTMEADAEDVLRNVLEEPDEALTGLCVATLLQGMFLRRLRNTLGVPEDTWEAAAEVAMSQLREYAPKVADASDAAYERACAAPHRHLALVGTV